ncbi:MAG TPA: ribosomal-protein-alanine N-acetyltransferase [Alphaproteobacteria bacterium]|nr:ribosomal-protein-alanine N-acetyltransferase [Alphaproteobacteria bacterium]
MATPFFAAAIALLHQRCFNDPWSEAAAREILAMPGVFCLIAANGDGDGGENPAGFVICRLAADECEIIAIGVAPKRRRAGIASALLAAAMARARGLGAKNAFLEVAVDNFTAAALYRKQGFAEAGKRPDYYRRRQGRVDALIMAKIL